MECDLNMLPRWGRKTERNSTYKHLRSSGATVPIQNGQLYPYENGVSHIHDGTCLQMDDAALEGHGCSHNGTCLQMDDTALEGHGCSLSAVAGAELAEDVVDVGFNGCLADAQGCGDFLVAVALDNQGQDVELS